MERVDWKSCWLVMYKVSHAVVHGRQIHVLYHTSHPIYSLYRILLTVSSAELGPAKSSPFSCEVARFSSHFLEGETNSLHWLKSRFSVRFGISLNICRWHETPLVPMLCLASSMVKMLTFLTPYNQNTPWGRTLKITCFSAPILACLLLATSDDTDLNWTDWATVFVWQFRDALSSRQHISLNISTKIIIDLS